MASKHFNDLPDQFPTANTSTLLGLLDGDAVDVHGYVNYFLDKLPKAVDKALSSFIGAILLAGSKDK